MAARKFYGQVPCMQAAKAYIRGLQFDKSITRQLQRLSSTHRAKLPCRFPSPAFLNDGIIQDIDDLVSLKHTHLLDDFRLMAWACPANN